MTQDPYASAPMSPALEQALGKVLLALDRRPPTPMHRRVWRGIIRHFDHRYGEWWTTLVLLRFGWILYFPPPVFDNSRGFAVLAQWAAEETWGMVCLIVAGLHLCALVVNGTFPRFTWSPHIRATSSLVAFFLWGQIALGIWLSGNAPTGASTYALVAALEIYNFLRAMRDVGVVHGQRANNG